MDHHIKSFLRVLRELDDADELIRAFSKWENTALSVPDQWRLLDFPDPQTQAANIAASSTLTKENLLKRADEAPSQLSTAEVDPEAFVDEDEADEYMVRRDGVLFHAHGAVGVGSSMVGSMWKLQRLAWPRPSATECVDREGHLDGTPTDQDASEHSRAVEFQRLREHFKSNECSGLCEGLLRDVFLVIDKDSAASVLSPPGFVDDMWAWAVDPDYDLTRAEQSSPRTTTAFSEGVPPGSSRYPGYVRVRLQQLVHRFYKARRFRGSAKYPSMATLWAAAQTSKHRAFVSLEEDEARSWGMDRFVGSAMRAQPPRVVYGPAKKIVAPAE